MKSIIRPVFSLIVMSAMTASFAVLAEAGKCSPCQLAKSIRDAAAQSIKDAQMAALVAGKPYTREAEWDRVSRNQTVAACCEYCAQPGSLGCQGENSARCNTCQQGLIKMSIAEAAAAALAAIEAAKEMELDIIPAGDASRAPREELTDPCACGVTVCDTINACKLDEQLCALRCCCAALTQRLVCQGNEARKCCKNLKHKIKDVEELVETVIDQSADCCSLTETLLVSVIDQSAECCSVIDDRLGDLGGSALDIPLCQFISITDVVNAIDDADIISWLKSIYVLLYNVHLCTCCQF